MVSNSATNDVDFIIFYSLFILFVAYVGGLAGQSIVIGTEELSNFGITEVSLNPFTTFGVFFSLMLVGTPFTFLGILLFTPYSIGLIYIALKWARGTG